MSISTQMGEQKEIKLAQGTIRYRESGSGDTLVFIHGILVNGDLWRKIVPGLAAHYRCIVPDLPLGAHELSFDPEADLTPSGIARIIAAFLEALELTNVTIIANDTGGAFTQIAITEYTKRVSRLVLTNCDAFENFLPAAGSFFQLYPRIPGGMSFLALTMKPNFARKLLVALLSNAKIEKPILDSFFKSLDSNREARCDLAKVLKGISNRYTKKAATKFAEIHYPVLLAWGEDDILLFSKKYAHRLAAAFPNSHLEFIPKARSFVMQDQPEKLQVAIESFLKTNLVAR